MRRMSSAAGDQLDPRELIARVTAEHDSPSGRTVSTGRHHATTAPPVAHVPAARTGAHRVPDDRIFDDGAPDPTVVPAVPSPRRPDAPDPGGPGDSGDGSLVEVDREVAGRRSRVRRLAPFGLGAAVVLAATMVFTLLQPGAEDPDLGAALANDSSRRASSDISALPTGPSADSATLTGVTSGAGDQVGAARAAQVLQAQQAAKREAARKAAATQASGPSAPRAVRPAAAPAAGAAQVAGDGVQAALKMGWNAAGGDEFAGNGLGAKWSAYDGPGHAGQGRRTPDAVSVENGNLVIRGDSQGNTGGIAWGEDQQYGKWEMRAKFPKGDKQYHPVLLLWPADGDGSNGETDFAETNSAADDVSFFLHHGGGQEAEKKALDLTQWHNYAVEWTPGAVRGYIDGVQWFESTDSGTIPKGPMHATIQLDYFPDGGSPQPSEMQVAWMRQYK